MIQAFCFSHCSSGLRTRQSGRIKSYQYSNKELGIFVPELLISGLRSSMEKWIFNIGKSMSKSFLHFLPIFLAQLMISQSWARQKHCKTFKYVTQNMKKGLVRHKNTRHWICDSYLQARVALCNLLGKIGVALWKQQGNQFQKHVNTR